MDNKLGKLFDKLETIKEKEADLIEQIKNYLYDMDEADEADDYEDDEELDEEDEQ